MTEPEGSEPEARGRPVHSGWHRDWQPEYRDPCQPGRQTSQMLESYLADILVWPLC